MIDTGPISTSKPSKHALSRRLFVGSALSAAAISPLLGATAGVAADAESDDAARRKVKLGVVGFGGRGNWIAGLFRQHGGYEIHAVADYFPEVAKGATAALGVDESRCFSGLSGYRKVIDSGIEAIALETPPCFFPDHAAAAVEAGLHVYMAKPVAVDVPGALRIGAAGQLATQKKQVFHVDYQIPTDPGNIEVVRRIQAGEMGPLARLSTFGIGGGHAEPPRDAPRAAWLRGNAWSGEVSLGGGYINNFDIHSIDAAIWALAQRPISAVGYSRVCRLGATGNSADVLSVLFEYTGGLIHDHLGQALPNSAPGVLECRVYSATTHAVLSYFGAATFHQRNKKPFSANVVDLYPEGAKRNIADFYRAVIDGNCGNGTVQRAVDGCLACILGREAGARRTRLTMEELLKENRRVEADLAGLNV